MVEGWVRVGLGLGRFSSCHHRYLFVLPIIRPPFLIIVIVVVVVVVVIFGVVVVATALASTGCTAAATPTWL